MNGDIDQVALDYSIEHIKICCCGGMRFIRVNVPMGHPMFGKAIPCICQRSAMERERADRMRRRCGMSDAELRQWQFELFVPQKCYVPDGQDRAAVISTMKQYKTICEQFAADPSGWLVLQGSAGVGKTHLAYAIAARALERGKAVFAHNVPEILDMLRNGYREDTYDTWIEELKLIDLLVLDDLGAQQKTEWADEKLYQVIDRRYALQRPLVVTTNWNLDRDDCPIDSRILSRLRDGSKVRGGMVQIIRFPVGDYRPQRRAA